MLAVDFSSVLCKMVSMRSEGRSTPSFRSVPSVAFETFPMFARMTVSLPLARKKDRRAIILSTLLSFRRSMAMMSLALCPEVVSQAPQHLRSSET